MTRTVKKTGNWGESATWEPAGVPKAEDDLVLNGAFTLNVNAAGLVGRSFEGSAGTVAFSGSAVLTLGTTTQNAGGFAWKVSGTCKVTVEGEPKLKFISTSEKVEAIFCGGQALPWTVLQGAKGKWRFEDTFRVSGNSYLELVSGELLGNGQTWEVPKFASTGALTRVLNIENCHVKLAGTSLGPTAYNWEISGATLTFLAAGSNIDITDTTTTTKLILFTGATERQYGELTFTGQNIEIVVENKAQPKFTKWNLNNAAKPTTVKGTIVGTTITLTEGVTTGMAVGEEIVGAHIPNGTTLKSILGEKSIEMSAATEEVVGAAETIEVLRRGVYVQAGTSAETALKVAAFSTTAKSGERARIGSASSEAGKPNGVPIEYTGSGIVSLDWLVLHNLSGVKPNNTFYAGLNSLNRGGNLSGSEGWHFTAPTAIPLNAAASKSASSLAPTAKTRIPLNGASSKSSAASVLTAPAILIPAAASSRSSAGLGLAAKTQIPLAAARGTSAASLMATAKTQIPLNGAASKSTSALSLSAHPSIALNPAASSSSTRLALAARTFVVLGAARSQSTAHLGLSVPTRIPLASARSSSAAALTLSAPVLISLSAAASSHAALSLVAKPSLVLNPATSRSGASLGLRARAALVLAPARASSSASLRLTAPASITLSSAVARSGSSLALSTPASLVLAPARSRSSTHLGLSIPAGGTSTVACTLEVVYAIGASEQRVRTGAVREQQFFAFGALV